MSADETGYARLGSRIYTAFRGRGSPRSSGRPFKIRPHRGLVGVCGHGIVGLGAERLCGDAHDLPGRRRVRAVRRQDSRLDVRLLRGDPGLGSLFAPLLTHAVHLVAHDLAPVRPVLVGLHDRDVRARVVVQHQRRALVAVVDDGDAAADHLVAGDDHAQRRERGRVVLDDHAVVRAQHRAVLHVPPAHRGRVGEVVELGAGRVERAVGVGNVAAVVLLRRVRLEPQVVVVVLVGVREDECRAGAVDLALVGVRHGGVEADLAALGVVDGANLKAVLVAAHVARVPPAVARGAVRHHARLREDARAAVGTARERDAILVVVREVEVA
mmetsp:Transcript_28269/g.95192  ORF Transcript_28269/g.95192 Transcript_28269/m.95192 type:complete len:327 (-) Transcript_28269:829-1809(-)